MNLTNIVAGARFSKPLGLTDRQYGFLLEESLGNKTVYNFVIVLPKKTMYGQRRLSQQDMLDKLTQLKWEPVEGTVSDLFFK